MTNFVSLYGMHAVKMNQLEEVSVAHTYNFNSDDWQIFTTNSPNIKSLTIDDTALNTEGLEHIVSNLKHLEEFIIEGRLYDSKFRYVDLRLILENCKNIKCIDVMLNEKPGHDQIFEEFAEKLKTIKFEPVFA